jgi:hypothetical protein
LLFHRVKVCFGEEKETVILNQENLGRFADLILMR